jgi:mannose-6-phosphate isomerase-like protein (cupin superfamily)
MKVSSFLWSLAIWSLAVAPASAQRFLSTPELPCPDGTGPVRSTTLHSDSACTSFLLCIDAGVRPHLHRTHTEHVFVLDGTAEMMLGDSTRTIRTGDVILITPGTPHAVKVTSSAPLRVISIQSPHFDGTDRVWLDER